MWTQHHSYNIPKKGTQALFAINNKISKPHTRYRRIFERWKSTVVQPLIKAISKGTVKTNYRPVNNLSFISIIIQKCTLDQLPTHCDKYSLLLEYQSAYRKFYSCETSLLKFSQSYSMGYGTPTYNSSTYNGCISCLWYIWSWHFASCITKKIWHHKHSTDVVPELPKTKKNQCLYQWFILIRTDHGLCHTPRIHTRHIPIYLLCLNTVWKAIRLKLNEAKTEFIYFWSRQQLTKTTHNTINIVGESTKRSTKVR